MCPTCLRQRAEHNEGLLATLEEVALHQQSIERIELLGRLCPKLRILYLQNNLIPKIEGLHKLKVRQNALAVQSPSRRQCTLAVQHASAIAEQSRVWRTHAWDCAASMQPGLGAP